MITPQHRKALKEITVMAPLPFESSKQTEVTRTQVREALVEFRKQARTKRFNPDSKMFRLKKRLSSLGEISDAERRAGYIVEAELDEEDTESTK